MEQTLLMFDLSALDLNQCSGRSHSVHNFLCHNTSVVLMISRLQYWTLSSQLRNSRAIHVRKHYDEELTFPWVVLSYWMWYTCSVSLVVLSDCMMMFQQEAPVVRPRTLEMLLHLRDSRSIYFAHLRILNSDPAFVLAEWLDLCIG